MANLDADDPVDDSDSDDGDSDDDTAILMAELNKIKAEKQQEEEEKVITIYYRETVSGQKETDREAKPLWWQAQGRARQDQDREAGGGEGKYILLN